MGSSLEEALAFAQEQARRVKTPKAPIIVTRLNRRVFKNDNKTKNNKKNKNTRIVVIMVGNPDERLTT